MDADLLSRLSKVVEAISAREPQVKVVGPISKEKSAGLDMSLIERSSGERWRVTYTPDAAEFRTLEVRREETLVLQSFASVMSANIIEWWYTRGRTDQNPCVVGRREFGEDAPLVFNDRT